MLLRAFHLLSWICVTWIVTWRLRNCWAPLDGNIFALVHTLQRTGGRTSLWNKGGSSLLIPQISGSLVSAVYYLFLMTLQCHSSSFILQNVEIKWWVWLLCNHWVKKVCILCQWWCSFLLYLVCILLLYL